MSYLILNKLVKLILCIIYLDKTICRKGSVHAFLFKQVFANGKQVFWNQIL